MPEVRHPAWSGTGQSPENVHVLEEQLLFYMSAVNVVYLVFVKKKFN